MKAMIVLALALLPLLARADVVIPEDEKRSRPPVKTDTAATTATTTTATTATQTEASQAPVPERRRSQFPFVAITTIGFVLIVALTARRRRASKTL